MKFKAVTILLLISFSMFFLPLKVFLSQDIFGLSYWGTGNSQIIVAPGESGIPLTFVLFNSMQDLLNITIKPLSFFPLSPYKYYNSSLQVNYPFWAKGQAINFTFLMNVSPQASQGVYQEGLNVSYCYLTTLKCNSEVIYVDVPILGFVKFDVNSVWGTLSSPLTASPGERLIPLTVIIKNVGNVLASNVTIYLNSTYPVQFLTKTERIGFIPPGGYNTATLIANVFQNATSGLFFIPIKIHYFNQNVTSSFPIVISSGQLTLNAYTNPPELFPGTSIAEIDVSVINSGSGLIENATAKLISSFRELSSNEVNLGTLPPGIQVPFRFLISIPDNVSPGVYMQTIEVNYNGGEVNYSFPININAKANIIVSNVFYPTLTPGASQNYLTIELKNIGSQEVKNLKVIFNPSNVFSPHVSSSNPLGALTSSTVFAGNLNPGQEENITFVIDVSSGINPGNYPVVLTLIWNQSGSTIPLYKNVEFNVAVSQPLTSEILAFFTTINIYSLIFYIVIIIAITSIVSYRLARRK